MENYRAIDYDHSQDDLQCNGILSNMDGPFEAYWTFEQQGQLATKDRALTEEAFALLWDGIAASISEGGLFWRCLITDPTRLIDPDRFHVIATVEVLDSYVRHRTFMVPSNEADPAFAAWLEALAVPGCVGCGGSVPARKGQATAPRVKHTEAAGRSRVPA